jgi:hypothetical protein
VFELKVDISLELCKSINSHACLHICELELPLPALVAAFVLPYDVLAERLGTIAVEGTKAACS